MPKQDRKSGVLARRAASLPERVAEAAGVAERMARRLAEAATQLPGAEQAQAQFRRAEQRVLRELKHRMDAAQRPRLGEPSPEEVAPEINGTVSRTYVIPLLQSPRKLLEELLERSQLQTREQAEEDFYSVLLSELVPDEARILALLSDGTPQAVVHIGTGAPIGPVRTRVSENYSVLGRPAQVKLLEFVPLYLDHLKSLRLVEEGPEDPALESRYQIIEGMRELREEVEQQRNRSRASSVRLLRRTVRLAPLGRSLWSRCIEGSGPKPDMAALP